MLTVLTSPFNMLHSTNIQDNIISWEKPSAQAKPNSTETKFETKRQSRLTNIWKPRKQSYQTSSIRNFLFHSANSRWWNEGCSTVLFIKLWISQNRKQSKVDTMKWLRLHHNELRRGREQHGTKQIQQTDQHKIRASEQKISFQNRR